MTQAYDRWQSQQTPPHLRAVSTPVAPTSGCGLHAIDWRSIEDCMRSDVYALMRMLGPPRLRCIMFGGLPFLLEGSHRAVCARHLDMTVQLEVLPLPKDKECRIRDFLDCRSGKRHGDHIWGRLNDLWCMPGPWVDVPWRVVTVSVRSGCNVSSRVWRWTMRWWNQQSLTRLASVVLPPLPRSTTWCASNVPAWWQPGN